MMAVTAFAQSAHSFLRSGDQEYENDNFQLAEEDYRRALEEKESLKGAYNLGNSIYQQKRFDEAIRHFGKAAEMAADNRTKAKAFHNLGNALFGKQEFDKSIDAYKNALRLNPKDVETKFNLGQAQRQLRIQQQQQQQQNSDAQEEQQQEQQQEQAGNEQQQSQPQEQQSVGNEGKDQAQPQPKDLSKEEAQKLLEIMDEEERKVQEKLKKAQSKPSKSAKDW